MTRSHNQSGFTLLEVLVTLSIMAIGVTLTLSLISGSLRNIRKVQMRTRTIQHAETVMELALLDDAIKRPTVLRGDFEDGTRWSIQISEMEVPRQTPLSAQQVEMPIKLFSYSVEIMGPESVTTDLHLYTLKLVNVSETATQMRPGVNF
jgi:prepilin-type N-terminal cleavage/methylation domain-containing protein